MCFKVTGSSCLNIYNVYLPLMVSQAFLFILGSGLEIVPLAGGIGRHRCTQE